MSEVKSVEKKIRKSRRFKDEVEEIDVVVPVALTILCKHIEGDEEKGLFLVGTMIYRVINPPPELERFQLRINEKMVTPEIVDERRARPIEFLNETGEEAKALKAPEDFDGFGVTSNVRIPLVIDDVEGVGYPFKLVKAKCKIEFSSPAFNGIQYRPSIMEATAEENWREIVVLKPHKKPGAKEGARVEETYDQDAFDQSKSFDTITPIPNIKIDSEIKGKTMYFPKLELEWELEAPFTKKLVSTIVPIILLIWIQWLNWFLTLQGETPEYLPYFQNVVTVILTLVNVIPNIKDTSTSLREKISSVEFMIFTFFLGTGLAAYPGIKVSLLGLVLTTASLAFPLMGVSKYKAVLREILHKKKKLAHVLPDPVVKARGEVVDFKKLKFRPMVADKKKKSKEE
jgi:hypothetical protein